MDEKQATLAALGSRIASERKKRGVTLERLAYEMGISKGNLSDIERGKKDPRYSTLRAIAEGLEIPLSKLLREPL